ncbi:DUF4832 domain-containing protein [Leptobacterium sp. I13]|uniref:DUF4832 domain-containing protein n=1 Tax=Leptobacterium meishanense TaxID=3128904 RepID=UPI0030EBBFE1
MKPTYNAYLNYGLAIIFIIILFACSRKPDDDVIVPDPDPGTGTGTDPSWVITSEENTFELLSSQEDFRINPLRGLYKWRNEEVAPVASREMYQRYFWKDIETAMGVYDFSRIIDDYNAAIAEGKRFAFRIRAMAGHGDTSVYMPSYIVNNPSCQNGCVWTVNDYLNGSTLAPTAMPDWNDPFLIARANALFQALATGIPDSNNLAWIDIGMVGAWGEWAISDDVDYSKAPGTIVPITEASEIAYVDMHLNAFPDVLQLAKLTVDHFNATDYAMNTQQIASVPVGLRVDCIGETDFFQQFRVRPEIMEKVQENWKKAPFIGEFCRIFSGNLTTNFEVAINQIAEFHISAVGNGNVGPNGTSEEKWQSLTAAEQNSFMEAARSLGYKYAITASDIAITESNGTFSLRIDLSWLNEGNAPTYEGWTLEIWLQNTSTSELLEEEQLDLLSLTDMAIGTVQTNHTLSLPTDIASGDYTIAIRIRSENEVVTSPLLLSNTAMSEEGNLVLGVLHWDEGN